MLKLMRKISEDNIKRMNPDIFVKNNQESIASYIVKGLRVLESLPYIKFVGYEHVTDESQIDIKLNRKHIKNRIILKDKSIKKVISTSDSAYEKLILRFEVNYDGETRYIRKELLIPAYVDKYHLLLNGKEILPQAQIIDMSTHIQGKSLKIKSILQPIDLYKKPIKRNKFVNTKEESFEVDTFILNLFTKELNPLYYYLAKFGLLGTIKYFGMSGIIDITDREYDNGLFYYFKINKSLYIEVDRRFFDADEYVKSMTYMIYEAIPPRFKFNLCEDIDYWVVKLGSLYTTNTKNQHNKGLNVLISFDRLLDEITKSTLRLDKKHLINTHALLRWGIQNFNELRHKDNFDLCNKRMRCNETIAYYFIHNMAERVNVLLNKKKLTIESICKIFNWGPEELVNKILASDNSSVIRYGIDINCFQMLNALRFTFLGPQSMKGGKNISNDYRDIYPSYFGRIDVNAIGKGPNTCLTGFLVPTCKIYGNGFFSKEVNEPDEFYKKINKLRKKVYDKSILNVLSDHEYEKQQIIDKCLRDKKFASLPRNENGAVIIRRKREVFYNEQTGATIIPPRRLGFLERPYKYINSDGQKCNENGAVIITSKYRNRLNDDGAVIISRIK